LFVVPLPAQMNVIKKSVTVRQRIDNLEAAEERNSEGTVQGNGLNDWLLKSTVNLLELMDERDFRDNKKFPISTLFPTIRKKTQEVESLITVYLQFWEFRTINRVCYNILEVKCFYSSLVS
jgi:hypothetical protein